MSLSEKEFLKIPLTCPKCGESVTPSKTWVIKGNRMGHFDCRKCKTQFRASFDYEANSWKSLTTYRGGRKNEIDGWLERNNQKPSYVWNLLDELKRRGVKRIHARIATELGVYVDSKQPRRSIQNWLNANPRASFEDTTPKKVLYWTSKGSEATMVEGFRKDALIFHSEYTQMKKWFAENKATIIMQHITLIERIWKGLKKIDPSKWTFEVYHEWENENLPDVGGRINKDKLRYRGAFRSLHPEYRGKQYSGEQVLGVGGKVKAAGASKKNIADQFTWTEVMKVYAQIPTKYRGIDVSLLNKTLFAFLISSGARNGDFHVKRETIGIWLQDFSIEDGTPRIKEIFAKGSKTWTNIILNDRTYSMISNLVESYKAKDSYRGDYALFHIPELPPCRCGKKHLTQKYVNWVIKTASKKADVTYKWKNKEKVLLHAHIMRKIYATYHVLTGTPLEVLVDINVGWKTIDTAKDHYIAISDEYMRLKSRAASKNFFLTKEQFKEIEDDFSDDLKTQHGDNEALKAMSKKFFGDDVVK